MTISLLIGAVIISLILSAFFSGSEVAIFSMPRARLESMAKTGNMRAKKLRILIQRPKTLLAALLLSNTITATALGFMVLVAGEKTISQMGIKREMLPLVMLGLDVAMTILILIFGEITPKLIAARFHEVIGPMVATPVGFLTWLLSPIIKIFLWVSEAFLRVFGISLASSPSITKEEIQTLVSVGENTGVLEPEEAEMVEGFFGFKERVVSEIMVPRVRMVAIPETTTVAGALNHVKEHGFSRVPIFAETIDHIKGVLLVKDLLSHLDNPDRTISDLVKAVSFVPENKPLADLLKELQASNVHLAIVMDEYGGTHGMITIEDILEEIFGEIKDEYDEDEISPWQISLDGELTSDAALGLHEVAEIFEMEIPEEEVDTLGGLLVSKLGRIPKPGETIAVHGLEITALEIKGTRIQKIKTRVIPPESDSQEDSDAS